MLERRQIVERIVWALFVVFDHPPVNGLADVLQAQEQMLVQQFLAERAVEPLDVGVLVGLAGLDVLDGHAVRLRPLHEDLAQELGAVVGSQHLRQPVIVFQLFEDAHQPL